MRVGWGLDAHRFCPAGRVLLAGVVVDESRGVAATSDGDVAAHAVADALLGAAALGDLGVLFPSDEACWEGADSMVMLAEVASRIETAGYSPASLDLTIVAEMIRVAPYRDRIRESLAACLGVDIGLVSVKATTTDGMGFAGSDEGLAAIAVTVLEG
jgi:2-C-methyl-D-erythritol 2,4-cyclodiphosphate synthase